MNSIETIICLILLLMAVPDLCGKLGRPALANVCFVVFGLALGPWVQTDVVTMVKEAGEVGFLLVLFEVGLEIELPKLRELLPSLRFALVWSLVQYPVRGDDGRGGGRPCDRTGFATVQFEFVTSGAKAGRLVLY